MAMSETLRAAAASSRSGGASVAVRMYRIGLGDCFFLTFQDGERRSHVLIDCGTLGVSDPDRSVGTAAVGEHLLQQLPQGCIDLVIATHEHADHLSGFRDDDSPFRRMTFANVWMSWCEKPGDPLAERLKARKAAAVRALQAARPALAANGHTGRLQALDNVLEFAGLEARDGKSWTAAALDFLRQQVDGKVNYLEPGMPPIELPNAPDVRVFVLGPPRDEKLITRLDQKGATYGIAFDAGDADGAKLLRLDGDADSKQRDFEETLPFDSDHPLRVPAELIMGERPVDDRQRVRSSGIDQLARLYAGRGRALHEPDPTWRQVENDWLDSPEALALKLDNATNNSSLALAIELPDSRVLLFPGDAQVGNWQSWANLAWPGAGRDGSDVSGLDLLRRTVLYKVGHHGSHNATLREHGLEEMVHPDLVAMLPVDERFAHEKKDWLRMPLQELLDALRSRTKGRIIRADQSHEELAAQVQDHPSAWQAFLEATQTNDDRLYIEHVIRY